MGSDRLASRSVQMKGMQPVAPKEALKMTRHAIHTLPTDSGSGPLNKLSRWLDPVHSARKLWGVQPVDGNPHKDTHNYKTCHSFY